MKWHTKEGEKIELKDMDDQHLTNCIRLLRKNIKELETKGMKAGQPKSALEQLLKERLNRDTYSFAQDQYQPLDDRPKLPQPRQTPKSFMETLREI